MNYQDLGLLALKKRDYQEAVNIFKRALEKGKAADAFFGLGVAHYHLGDLPTARWAFYQALDVKSDHAASKEYIARIERPSSKERPAQKRKSRFRAFTDHLEIYDGSWRKFFVKGVNIGLGLPGYFPGEYAVKRGTYLKWFGQIADLGANVIRVYTILPPDFYEALSLFNRGGKRLYFFQEIWTELPAGSDFHDDRFLEGLRNEIRNAVDVIYGNAALPEQPGHAHGTYEYDVSPLLAGFILGREWEACAVKEYNERNRQKSGDFDGQFLHIRDGNPFEVWIAEICDFLQQYEDAHYHVSHPVATVSWPTLDPLVHPAESTVEEEAKLQGFVVNKTVCNNNEDSQTLDVAKIVSKKGNGFFAVYHVYPYYPDFMNNDYEKEDNPYLAYLQALKNHHGAQPVLIAEFGVPTSRESAHWQRNGWNHGGHSEKKQGEINGLLMRSIREAGMCGGILFSWCDEWFKKNWIFQPYELPPERKPFWFNVQDPEENYGLLAAYPSYPGKKVRLAGHREDWQNAQVLYRAKDAVPAFLFNDGADGARELLQLAVQHEEGFLYLCLQTRGALDFTKAHYLIGLSTCPTKAGERLLPFGTNLLSPIGLTFVIHLAGRNRSRMLVTRFYDRYLNDYPRVIRPESSDEGAWVMMQERTNFRRISKDGKRFFPSHVSTLSHLRFGSLDPHHSDYHSLADFFYGGSSIELRIPWGLINITDPSSKTVLWMDKDETTRTTNGISLLAVSYRPEEGGLTARRTGGASNHTDSLPTELSAARIKTYSWDGWDTPVYHTYLKESYYSYQKVLRSIPEDQ
ncbi:MAG: tetratricopeptide repeat protein [Nitrospirota bacterium]